MVETAVVVNPAAASGKAPALWRSLAAEHPTLASARRIEVTGVAAAQQAIVAAIDSGIERLIVVGGDGSIHLAANVLLEHEQGMRVALGIVPSGTGSDLARTLGIPREPRAALRHLLAGGERSIDTIAMETADGRRRHVMNVASAGISGLVDAAVNAMPTRTQLAYLQATLSALRRFVPVTARVEVDGETWFDGSLFLLAVANGTTFGRGMRIAPRAELDDGLLDVVLIRAAPLWRIALQLPRVYLGTHLKSPFVQWIRGREVRLVPQADMPPFDLDGETWDPAAATWRVQPASLRILG